MFCKYCGKEIEDGVNFCPNCGNSQKKEMDKNLSNQELQDEVSKLCNLIHEKEHMFPKYSTERHYNDIYYGYDFTEIFADAVFFGTNISTNSKIIINALKKSIEDLTENIQDWNIDNAHKYWKCGIKESLKDIKNKKNGDFYFVSVAVPDFWQEMRCIVKITGLFGKFDFIGGIIYTPAPGSYKVFDNNNSNISTIFVNHINI